MRWGSYEARRTFFEILMKANNHIDLEEEFGFEVRSITQGDKKIVHSVYITPDYIIDDNKKEFFKVLSPILNENKKFHSNVYFGANPRVPPFDCKLKRNILYCKQGSKKTVYPRVRILFADIDLLHKDDIENPSELEAFLRKRANREKLFEAVKSVALTVISKLKEHGIEPFMAIYSGYGFQLLFALKEPIDKSEFKYYNIALAKIIMETIEENNIKFAPTAFGIPVKLSRASNKKKKEKHSETHIVVDEKVYDVARILRLPYTINWRYSVPVYTDIIYPEELEDYVVPFVPNEKIKAYVDSLKESLKNKKYVQYEGEISGEVFRPTEYSWTGKVVMGNKAKKAVIEYLRKYYVEGQRHNITMRLAGLLRAYGYRIEDVIEVVHKIYVEKADEDPWSDRERAIEDTYMKPPNAIAWWPVKAIEENLAKKYQKTKRGDYPKKYYDELEVAKEDTRRLKKILEEDVKRAKEEGRIVDVGFEVDEKGNVYID